MFLHISFIVISAFCNVQFETLEVPIIQMGLSSKGSFLNELFFPLRTDVPLKIMLYSQLAPTKVKVVCKTAETTHHPVPSSHPP